MAAVHIFRNAKDEAGAWENPVTALNFAYTALMGFIALMVGSFFLLYAYTVLMVFLAVVVGLFFFGLFSSCAIAAKLNETKLKYTNLDHFFSDLFIYIS